MISPLRALIALSSVALLGACTTSLDAVGDQDHPSRRVLPTAVPVAGTGAGRESVFSNGQGTIARRTITYYQDEQEMEPMEHEHDGLEHEHEEVIEEVPPVNDTTASAFPVSAENALADLDEAAIDSSQEGAGVPVLE